jgi:hypothetical protein
MVLSMIHKIGQCYRNVTKISGLRKSSKCRERLRCMIICTGTANAWKVKCEEALIARHLRSLRRGCKTLQKVNKYMTPATITSIMCIHARAEITSTVSLSFGQTNSSTISEPSLSLSGTKDGFVVKFPHEALALLNVTGLPQ